MLLGSLQHGIIGHVLLKSQIWNLGHWPSEVCPSSMQPQEPISNQLLAKQVVALIWWGILLKSWRHGRYWWGFDAVGAWCMVGFLRHLTGCAPYVTKWMTNLWYIDYGRLDVLSSIGFIPTSFSMLLQALQILSNGLCWIGVSCTWLSKPPYASKVFNDYGSYFAELPFRPFVFFITTSALTMRIGPTYISLPSFGRDLINMQETHGPNAI